MRFFTFTALVSLAAIFLAIHSPNVPLPKSLQGENHEEENIANRVTRDRAKSDSDLFRARHNNGRELDTAIPDWRSASGSVLFGQSL